MSGAEPGGAAAEPGGGAAGPGAGVADDAAGPGARDEAAELGAPDDALYASARDAVAGWDPRTPAETATRDEFLAALAAGPASLERGGPPSHLTASAFVFDTRRSHVLLCFHRKGQFWVQPGGHLEPPGDRSIEGAALRELLEETGLGPEVLRDVRIADLDHHELGSGFGRCASHLDIGVAATADREAADAALVVSDESDAVAWWPVGALPPGAAPGLGDRIAGVLARFGSAS